VVVRRRALIGLVVLLGVTALTVANGDGSPAHALAPNRDAATVEAHQLLGEVALPVSTTPLSQEPAGDARQLATPVIGPFFAAEVDRHAYWMTSASPEATIAAFRSHLPSGAQLVTATFGAGTESAAYALGTNRRFVIGPEQLMLSAVTLADGLTGVRADAQVRYVSPRRRSERVPLSARIVQVTKADVGTTPLVSVLVTRRAFVRMLASQVDALPFVGRFSGSFSCPSLGEPIVTFIFRAAPAGPVLARVSESAYTPTDPSPCAATTLTIRGHRLPPLLEGGILLKRAGKLLGVRLTG
jgi:hypothetical protein